MLLFWPSDDGKQKLCSTSSGFGSVMLRCCNFGFKYSDGWFCGFCQVGFEEDDLKPYKYFGHSNEIGFDWAWFGSSSKRTVQLNQNKFSRR